MRKFKGGATRDSDKDKPDYFGFMSSLVAKRFGQYMLKHQVQADGSLRSSSNWKSGIPEIEYVKSLRRHLLDIELHYEGFSSEAREEIEESVCAAYFNIQGLLFEILKKKYQLRQKR